MSEITRDQMTTEQDGVGPMGLALAPLARKPLPAMKPAPAPLAPSRRHLTELYRKVDAVFARTRARYRKSMACDSGCNGCCSRALEVTSAEAAFVRDAYLALPEATRGALKAHAAAQPGRCPGLGANGKCSVYAARPLACRVAGMPLRTAAPEGARQLPMLQVCSSNFVGQDLETLEAAAVLDMRRMGATLETISATHASEIGAAIGAKVHLSSAFQG